MTNAFPEIVGARRTMTAAARALNETTRKCYPVGAVVRMRWLGQVEEGPVVKHGNWFSDPAHVTFRNRDGVERTFNAAEENCTVSIVPA